MRDLFEYELLGTHQAASEIATRLQPMLLAGGKLAPETSDSLADLIATVLDYRYAQAFRDFTDISSSSTTTIRFPIHGLKNSMERLVKAFDPSFPLDEDERLLIAMDIAAKVSDLTGQTNTRRLDLGATGSLASHMQVTFRRLGVRRVYAAENLPSVTPPWVWDQIAQRLVANATLHAGNPRAIRAQMRERLRMTRLQITNDFEWSGRQGTGLGLKEVAFLVEAHGGQVSYATEEPVPGQDRYVYTATVDLP